MATQKPFPQAGFLRQLELLVEPASGTAHTSLPPALAHLLLASDGSGAATQAAAHLIQLLKARKAMLQAAFDTEMVADELRRYQKFSKPGQPTSHIVFLRQKQAGARHASNQSKQSFIRAAAAFVRDAGIEISPRVSLEVFATGWIDANVPAEFVPST
ncbi:MAG: hypothetical protein ABI127_02975 [Dokdonella sp.]